MTVEDSRGLRMSWLMVGIIRVPVAKKIDKHLGKSGLLLAAYAPTFHSDRVSCKAKRNRQDAKYKDRIRLE